MDGDWLRLGKAVQKARNGMGLSQIALGELAGVKRTAIQTIERGHTFLRITSTLRDVEHALGWGRGSVEIILAGGEPLAPGEPGELDSNGRLRSDAYGGLPLRMTQALIQGTTLDTMIVPLTPNVEMVVVVKGKPNATPEQLQLALLAWEEQRGHLGRLTKPQDEPGDTPPEPSLGA
jgi:transcriptional regulator with XRE-family HTH domain